MRPTPPFDPRLQAGGMYVTGPSQVYVQPPVITNQIIPHNYQPVPQFQQGYPVPPYPMPPPNLITPPQINNPIRVQPLPNPTVPTQIQPQRSQPGPIMNQYSQSKVYNNRSGSQYQQNNAAQEGQQNYQEGEEGQQEQEMKNQQIIMFWEHKFYTILERFQLIFEKVEGFRIDFQHLNEELRAVDSEQQWNEAKQHHQDYMEQLEEFTQELAGVINENANLVEQNMNDPNDQLIWKERYFELFEGYKAMEQELFELKESKGNDNQDTKLTDLMNNYRQLEREYSQAVNELSQLKDMREKSSEPSAVDKNYRQKLDFALREAEKYKDMLEHLSKENEQLDAMINELREDKKHLELALENGMQANVQQNYQEFKRAINQRDEEINILNIELKDLSEKYNYLVEAHNMLQSRLEQEDPQLKMKFGELEQQLDSKNRQIIELKRKVHEVEMREKTTIKMSEEYQKQLKMRAMEIEDQSNQIHKLKRDIANTISSRKNEFERDQNLFRKEHEARMKKVEEEYEEKLQILKKKLRKKEEEGENTALINIKIQSLEKKNKMLLQQIENLNAQLHAKEKQIIEMKRVGHIQQKVRQLQYQYSIAIEEKQQLNAALLQKNYDIDSLREQVDQFQSRIKQLSEKTYASSSNPLLAEIQELNNLVQLKQSQINKSRTNLALKEHHIADLEKELQKTKSTIISNEKLFEKEKDVLQESIRAFERKNQQNEKKMRDLEFQFGSVMKKNLEDEIKNLRAQNQARQQNIIRLEAEQLQLRSHISHYERVRATHSSDMEELTNRIKQLEASKFEMIRKMQSSLRDVKKKQKECKQLTESVKDLKDKMLKLEGQIVQNEKLIKQKDKVIQNLEGQLLVSNSRLAYITEQHDSLRMRRRDQTDLFFKQADELKKKLYEYEHINGERKQFREKFSTEITKIENEMIQRLKEQKQFLQSELAAALAQIGNVPNSQKKPNSLRKSKASEGIDYIQKRLFEFNAKIDDIIVKNRQLNGRQFGLNRQNINLPSSRSNRESQQQIKSLKAQIQELRKYIAKLQVEAAGQTIRYNPKNEIIFTEQEKTYNERIQFYQAQTNELEGRIENLIKVNSSLKERVDSLLKGESKNSAVVFYKGQLVISEETIENLNTKIKRLLDENRSLKNNNNETTTKMCRDYENKIFECENRIFSLERKISSLELQKIKTQNQRAIIQRNLNLVQTQLDSIKFTTEKQLLTHEKTSKQLSEQVITFQNQISQLLGKIRLLESENNRLSQAMHTSYSQQHILLNTPVKGSPKNASKK